MLETALYPTVKRFLEAAGFQVKGEIHGCDIVAVQTASRLRLAIVEMKLGFNLDCCCRRWTACGWRMKSGLRCRRPGADATAIHACIGSAG